MIEILNSTITVGWRDSEVGKNASCTNMNPQRPRHVEQESVISKFLGGDRKQKGENSRILMDQITGVQGGKTAERSCLRQGGR